MKSPRRFLAIRFAAIGGSVALALTLCLGSPPAFAQTDLKTPEDAMTAFGNAVTNNDEAALKALLGNNFRQIIPPLGADIRAQFLTAWNKSHSIQPTDSDHVEIAVGGDGWTLPIPLAKTAKGWHFDTYAGADEMRLRRIGRNELAVIQVAQAYVDAQREYYLRDPMQTKLLHYAQKFMSAKGKRDGLYYPTREGEQPSPLGQLFATAQAEGYKPGTAAKPNPYHGYYYRILKAQGPDAGGGAYDYVVRGNMIGGFALVAYPATYGNSGVMTFIVNQDGVVYQKNLGPDTAAIARKMTKFNPDATWQRN